MTLDVPLHLLKALDPARLSWLVPGLVEEKAAELIRSLPKALRRNYVPAPDFARAFFQAAYRAKPRGRDAIGGSSGAFPDPSDRRAGVGARLRRGRTGSAPAHELPLWPSATARCWRVARPVGTAADDSARRRTRLCRQRRRAAGAPRTDQLSRDAGSRCRSAAPPACPPTRRWSTKATRWHWLSLPIRCRRAPSMSAACAGWPLLGAGRQGQAGAQAIARVAQARPAVCRDRIVRAAARRHRRGRAQCIAGRRPGGNPRQGRLRCAVAKIGRQLFEQSMQRLQLAETILAAYAEVKPKLESKLIGWARGNLDDISAHLRQPGARRLPARDAGRLPGRISALPEGAGPARGAGHRRSDQGPGPHAGTASRSPMRWNRPGRAIRVLTPAWLEFQRTSKSCACRPSPRNWERAAGFAQTPGARAGAASLNGSPAPYCVPGEKKANLGASNPQSSTVTAIAPANDLASPKTLVDWLDRHASVPALKPLLPVLQEYPVRCPR